MMILANGFKRNLAAGMLLVITPSRTQFGKMLVALKTRKGALNYWERVTFGDTVFEELVQIGNVFKVPPQWKLMHICFASTSSASLTIDQLSFHFKLRPGQVMRCD